MSMDETEDEDMDDMEEPPHWSLQCGDIVDCKAVDTPYISLGNQAIQAVNLMKVGTAAHERVGNTINVKSVIITNYNSTGGSGYGRLFVVYDRQPNGTLPTYQTIFATVDYTGTVQPSFGLINPKNQLRFEILYYEQFFGNYSVNGYGYRPANGIDRVVINRPTTFKQSSNPPTIADIATGAIYVVQSGPGMYMQVRCVYEDE